MVRKLFVVLLVAGATGLGVRAIAGEEGDKHAKAKSVSAADESGDIFGVEIQSKKLRMALAGYEMDEAKVRCSGCKTALESSGSCDHCKVSMAGGKAYRSAIAYRLAKGMPMPAELVEACPKRCGQCKTAHKEQGFCEGCGVGFVADRMYTGKEDYEAAMAAHAILVRAAEAAKTCERCAVALVTDGECDHCKVKFKDGKMARSDG